MLYVVSKKEEIRWKKIKAVAVWRSGNGVGRINEALHLARLVLEWVTVFGWA